MNLSGVFFEMKNRSGIFLPFTAYKPIRAFFIYKATRCQLTKTLS